MLDVELLEPNGANAIVGRTRAREYQSELVAVEPVMGDSVLIETTAPREIPDQIRAGHFLDVIRDATVSGVINTPGPADKEILDGLEIRRAAVERGIPCITSIDTAKAMITAMSKASSVYSVQPLPSYRSKGFGY